jgi:hypothetical protein
LFLFLCEPIKDIVASCFEVSVELANTYLLENDAKKIPLKGLDDLKSLFVECFKLKNGDTVK